jgi:hypothetical protein
VAIKGKGRTRTRQPTRAPRRGPVPVPVPFARRRGVQLVAAFLVGILVFWGGVWLTNGLREQQRSDESSQEELLRRRAGSAWQTLIETEVGALGQVQLGAPPTIVPQVRAVVTGLTDDTPEDAVETLRSAASDLKEASDAIDGYALSEQIGDKGFDAGQVLRFLSARDEMVTALTLYRDAALLGTAAARLDEQQRKPFLDRAQSLISLAEAALARFQIHHQEALSASGINPANPTIPGLGG